jgi:1,5-anhydro-D-fructose reductase (1,5-anhydro-D-mannitol-forming)
MANVRWGLIGATVIGREWMVDAIRTAGGDIVAVMSTDAARGRAYADEFGIPKAVDSLSELFSRGVEAVYVSTTNDRHRDETIAAAEAGVHVLCEKPLSTILGDARAMVAACNRAGVVLATNHHLRNGTVASSMRQAIQAGRIGRPLAARIVPAGYLPEHLHGWRLRDPNAGAGAILDLTVHDADLLRFILSDEPESVAAYAQNGGLAASGIEDAALTLIRFRSGLLAQLFDGFTTRYAETRVEIHGVDGSLFVRDCMSQMPRGKLTFRSAAGEETIALDHYNYLCPGHPRLPGRDARRWAPGVNRSRRPDLLGDRACGAGKRPRWAFSRDQARRMKVEGLRARTLTHSRTSHARFSRRTPRKPSRCYACNSRRLRR